MYSQKKRPLRLRVPQSPEMVEKAAAQGRTQKRRHGIQLSVPRQDVRMAAKSKSRPQLRVPAMPAMRRSDMPEMNKGKRSKRSPDGEEEKDFVVEDHVVKMLDGEEGKAAEGRSALEVEDVSEAAEVTEAEAKPKSRVEKNKEAIQGRVKEVISNVVSSMERMVEGRVHQSDYLV